MKRVYQVLSQIFPVYLVWFVYRPYVILNYLALPSIQRRKRFTPLFSLRTDASLYMCSLERKSVERLPILNEFREIQ